MPKYLLDLPDWQMDLLKQTKETTQYSVAEILRRIIDNGLQQSEMNRLFPNHSGSLRLGR